MKKLAAIALFFAALTALVLLLNAAYGFLNDNCRRYISLDKQ